MANGAGYAIDEIRRTGRSTGLLVVAIPVCLSLGAEASDDQTAGNLLVEGNYCSATANYLFRACEHEAEDDYWVAVAICTNLADDAEREECLSEARTARREQLRFCQEQLDWRKAACRLLGQSRYDPPVNPALFDKDYTDPAHPNPYFPVKIGNRWEYSGGGEYNTVEVLDETKLIQGVRCVVVRDIVMKNGRVIEDTDDWYAQAKDGDVWYFGEEVKDYESYKGDSPMTPELVSIDGSFKGGRNGDKAGVIFRASPATGDAYLEEFSLGNAEDVTEVLSTTYRYGADSELDKNVPRQLADLLCSGDCVVTKNYSMLEPDTYALKYYAPGVGFFLEVNPETGEVLRLVSCNFDPRCSELPGR